MLLPLAAGGICVVLSEDEVADPDRFMRAVSRSGVTHLDVVPSFAAAIADHASLELPALQVFILGGEVLAPSLLNRLRFSLPQSRFFNMYGPTETCVDATAFEISADVAAGPVPIGRSLNNYTLHVLDECLRPLPRGARGEIHISGAGLARGYWRQPRLTAERFLPCPFGAPGERMYRTGDRGYFDADGELIFCGRGDDQVKLRGMRIELAEIEAALIAAPGVEQAALVLDDGGADKSLVAYVSAKAGVTLREGKLRATLAASLPAAMVPRSIVVLQTLPRLPNGKLDRTSLPKARQDDVVDHAEPETDLEAAICSLFASLTGADRVSARDNFFALGGHSLLAMRLVSRLRREHGHDVPIEHVFAHPTPRALAAAIAKHGSEASTYCPIVRLRGSGSLPPLFCVHPGAGLARIYERLGREIDARIPIYGVQARGLYGEAPPHASISEMAAAYVDAIRDVQPRGPYYLAGWSFGGVVAHEIAARLESDGETIRGLFLIDSYFSTVEADIADPVIAETSLAGVPAADGAGDAVLERMNRAFVRSARLIAGHTPRKITGAIVFFRANDNVDENLLLSLAAVTAGAIEIEHANGPHYSLLDPPHAARIGAALSRHLTGAMAAEPVRPGRTPA